MAGRRQPIAERIERIVKRAEHGTDQRVEPEQDRDLAEPVHHDPAAVGELPFAAVADAAMRDQLGQHGDMAAGDHMKRVAQDGAPDPSAEQQDAKQPAIAEHAGDMGAEPDRATHGDHRPDGARRGKGQQHAPSRQRIRQGLEQQLQRGAKTVIAHQQRVGVGRSLRRSLGLSRSVPIG